MNNLRYTVSPAYHIQDDTRWKTWDVMDSYALYQLVAACPTRNKAELVALALNQWDVLPQGVTT